jgi:hypothetical protein
MCPFGFVRSGSFRDGTPLTLPHEFGNLVAGDEEPFGNVEPQSNPTMFENQINWTISPEHFGNQVSFSLQVPSVVIVSPGDTGTTNINLTNLLGTNSATLSYFGAPVGVTVAFAPNPDTTTSIATVTVGSSVPVGRYVITVVGTETTPNIEYTKIHLVVAAGNLTP